MKGINILLGGLIFSGLSIADDTEIYGATAINENNTVKSNVLLIVDNSGSMRGDVVYHITDYDPAATYDVKYDVDEFYLDNDANTSRGIPISSLKNSDSTNCSDVVTTLETFGKVTGNFQQKEGSSSWDSDLSTRSNNSVRCKAGDEAYTLYTGHYLNYYHDNNYAVNTTRMEVVKKIVSDLTYTLDSVNLGMMRFDTSNSADNGGMIEVPIADITTNAETIRNTVNTYSPYSWTPLSETLFEAYRYYSGGNVGYGDLAWPRSAASSRSSSNYNKYDSPINHECQKNHIIMLTDGEPTEDKGANSAIQSLISGLSLPSGLSKSCSGHGGCMEELAYYMKNVDQSDEFTDDQVVTTYTIGAFGDFEDTEFLRDTAEAGGGEYYEAEDPDALSEAINNIILKILSVDATFTAPAISVNAFNNAEHSNELFYAVFKPDDLSRWSGNLKKFTLGSDGVIYGQDSSTPAIDSSTGYFSDKSQDLWSLMTDEEIKDASGIADGKEVTQGGAANLLDPASRTLYSEAGVVSGNTLPLLENIANATTLDVADDEVENLIKWIKGYNVKNSSDPTSPRYYMGDPLHSEPVVITYGGTEDDPDSTLYFGSNEGFIHAINTDTGEEEFAFIPQELLAIQNTNYENSTAAGNRSYGMDGLITSWMYDLSNNNLIHDSSGNVESGEHVYLYSGMRRGGRSYYGLNVTDRDNPKLLFKIQGGVTPGFDKLGQTWSKMTITKVILNGSERFVLFFAGGYDTNQDGNDTTEADSIGNAVYMVDATTGELLWTASNKDADLNISDMVNSMPASVSAVDISGDGNINYLFAADTGGRVFRFDINPGNKGADDFAQGGVIASIAGSNKAGNRRFYNKPNVALVSDKQYGDYLTIAIGSGYRAHPLNEDIEDRLYVIKDFHPYSAPTSYVTKTEAATNKTSLTGTESADSSKLYNASALVTDGESALTTSMKKLMLNGGGWYVTLADTGEKVLSESTTYSGTILFTTFSPSNATRIGCGGDTGQSKLYALNQITAMATLDLDGDGDVDKNDSSKTLTQSGIAPRPIISYRPSSSGSSGSDTDKSDGGEKDIIVGTETFKHDDGTNTTCSANNCYVIPQYWRQNEAVQ
jgi:type IV pilus assembly protein PilY1